MMFLQSENFSYFKKIEDDIWYISRGSGGLFKKNLKTGEELLEYMPTYDGVIVEGACTFNYFLQDGDEIWMFPRYAKNILIWNRRTNTSVMISFPIEPRYVGEYFFYALQTKEEVIVFPLSYQGILLIDKQTKKVTLDNGFYIEYEKIVQQNKIENNAFIFRSNIIIKEKTVYIPFYCVDKVLKYNYITKEFSLLDTLRKRTFIEQCDDMDVKMLIANKESCVLYDSIADIDFESLAMKVMDNMTKVFVYHDFIYFFTEKKIYIYDIKMENFVENEWVVKINETYSKRYYYNTENGIVDALFVFLEDDLLNMTYEYDNKQVVIIIYDGEIKIFEYERYVRAQESVLIAINTYKNNSIHDNISSVGTKIHHELINSI